MQKHKTTVSFLAAVTAAMFLVLPARAQEFAAYNDDLGVYLSAKLGGLGGGLKLKQGPDYNFDTLISGAFALGLRVTENFRFEAEFFAGAGNVSNYDHLKTQVVGGGINAYLTIPITQRVWFHLNGGAGLLTCELELGTGEYYLDEYYYSDWWFWWREDYYTYEVRERKLRESANYFYWSAGAGLEIALSRNISLDISGRYIGTPSQDFGDASKVALQLYGGFVGVMLNF